jgi:hypothetical protein
MKHFPKHSQLGLGPASSMHRSLTPDRNHSARLIKKDETSPKGASNTGLLSCLRQLHTHTHTQTNMVDGVAISGILHLTFVIKCPHVVRLLSEIMQLNVNPNAFSELRPS